MKTSIAPPCLRINGRPVVVRQLRLPIATDRFDYCARFANDDENGICGYGPTPVAACLELKELSDEALD